jgi:hypothetical protein
MKAKVALPQNAKRQSQNVRFLHSHRSLLKTKSELPKHKAEKIEPLNVPHIYVEMKPHYRYAIVVLLVDLFATTSIHVVQLVNIFSRQSSLY